MARTLTRVLVPTDFSETSDAALAYAKTLAARLGASLHLLHVFADQYTAAAYAPDVYAPLPPDVRERALRDREERLHERLGTTEKRRFRGTTEIVTGLAAKEIVAYAGGHDIDLIVMGTRGRRGVAHLLLGSVAEHVVRTASCPVLTVRDAPPADAPAVNTAKAAAARAARAARPTQETRLKDIITRILTPTDFSDTSDAALDYARMLATRFGASLHLLHVLDDPLLTEGLAAEASMTEAPSVRTALLEDARLRLRQRLEGCTTTEAVFGRGAATIVEYADQCGIDLIVMGTHGRTGLAHLLLGSVAERVVRTAPCPALTVGQVAGPARHLRPAEAKSALQSAFTSSSARTSQSDTVPGRG